MSVIPAFSASFVGLGLIFFFRWDYLVLGLFYGVGRISSSVYGWVMLKIFLFGVFGLFIYILVA